LRWTGRGLAEEDVRNRDGSSNTVLIPQASNSWGKRENKALIALSTVSPGEYVLRDMLHVAGKQLLVAQVEKVMNTGRRVLMLSAQTVSATFDELYTTRIKRK